MNTTSPHRQRVFTVKDKALKQPAIRTNTSPAGPAASDRTATFAFRFSPGMRRVAALFGITPTNSDVHVGDETLVVRFGPWKLATPLSNVTGASVTGPYRLIKVAGPPHLSFVDKGVTFATNASEGVCVRFATPVRGIDPFGLIRHPGATVTVDEPERLRDLLNGH